MLKVSRTSVNAWVTHSLTYGISGLDDKHNPGRPAQLSAKQQISLKEFVQRQSLSESGERLMARDVSFLFSLNFA
jgi:transposase